MISFPDQARKVLLAVSCSQDGISGPESWSIRLLAWLRNAGIDARAAVLIKRGIDENSAIIATLKKLDIPFVIHRSVSIRDDTFFFVKQVAHFLPGLFIANHIPAALYAAKNVQQFGVKSAMVIHSDDPYYYKLIDAFVLLGKQSAVNTVVVVSQYLFDQLAPRLSSRVDIHKIHYGAPLVASCGSPEDSQLSLLYIGRFSRQQKRVEDVARALCLACATIPGARAAMVGDGPERKAVLKILASVPGGERVNWLGSLTASEVLNVLPSHHVIVLLSDYEGLPISLMEAMSAGLIPVVTPMASGISELVIHGKTGLIVADRHQAFVAAIQKLHQDPEMVQQMSLAAKEHMTSNFSADSIVHTWMSLISESPQPYALPSHIDFPVSSWLDFWVDSSMADGWRKYHLLMQRWLWRCWDCMPDSSRLKIRRIIKLLRGYDGNQLRTSANNHR
jgi:glycosyltransferase involved in cell wall biosynthesis